MKKIYKVVHLNPYFNIDTEILKVGRKLYAILNINGITCIPMIGYYSKFLECIREKAIKELN